VSTSALEGAEALIVIDMQNSFLHPDGILYYTREAPLLNIQEVIEVNGRAVATARSANIPVVFTRHMFRPGLIDAGPATKAFLEARQTAPLIANTWDTEVVDQLKYEDALYVDKSRMDAFYNTDLEVFLRGLGANNLVITGIVTNASIETTVRSAAMRDYSVTVISDGCTTYSAEYQAASLD